MPPKLLFDVTGIDLDKVLFGPEEIRKYNPQRGDMEHVDAIVYADDQVRRIIGYKDVRADEFWVDGHIPGRPLLPGVVMIEAAAQVSSYYTAKYDKWEGFIGFGGVDGVRFRQQVQPGARLYILVAKLWERHGRVRSAAQGMVNGNIAFEAEITGIRL